MRCMPCFRRTQLSLRMRTWRTFNNCSHDTTLEFWAEILFEVLKKTRKNSLIFRVQLSNLFSSRSLLWFQPQSSTTSLLLTPPQPPSLSSHQHHCHLHHHSHQTIAITAAQRSQATFTCMLQGNAALSLSLDSLSLELLFAISNFFSLACFPNAQ